MKVFILTIDGRAVEKVYTNLLGLCNDYTDLPYNTIRKALHIADERIYAKGNHMYRVSRAEVVKIAGRGGNNLEGKGDKSAE